MSDNSSFVACFKHLITTAEESKMAELKRNSTPYVRNKHLVSRSANKGSTTYFMCDLMDCLFFNSYCYVGITIILFFTDPMLEQGELERELLQTYDATKIADLLTKITPQLHRKAIAEQVVQYYFSIIIFIFFIKDYLCMYADTF